MQKGRCRWFERVAGRGLAARFGSEPRLKVLATASAMNFGGGRQPEAPTSHFGSERALLPYALVSLIPT